MTDSDRSLRIRELEDEVRTRGAAFQVGEDFDDSMREAFLAQILAFEDAPSTTLRDRLAEAGHTPGRDLHGLIGRLAEMNVVIESTNHLDDDSLLQFLLAFLEHPVEFPDIPDLVMHIDVIGSGSEEDNQLFLKYYASEEDRQHWQREFPDYEVPSKQNPPFDRDRFLPRAHEEAPS